MIKESQNAEKDTDDTLIFAHVIFRHGQRNILNPYPHDPYNSRVYWPEGFEQLTNKGKRQMFFFGQYLRRRYDKLIGKKYSPNDIYVHSTDFDRTIMSAQVCLAGMYPPTADEIWNDDLLWQPIPVHTIPWNMDFVLTSARQCQAYKSAHGKYMNECPEVQKVYLEHATLLEYWSNMSGWFITTINAVYILYDTLITEKDHKKRLPKWAEEALEPNGTMEYIAKLYLKSITATTELARLRSGFLIKEIMERFKQKIESKLVPNRSLCFIQRV